MICHLDCSTGASGDKLLGALLDAGSASGLFTADMLSELIQGIAEEARVVVARGTSHGIAAVKVSVEAAEAPPHRHLSDIVRLLGDAPVADPVRQRAVAVFSALAEVEAAVHGTTLEAVHFHEVGALDSILDVVGVCAGLEALGVERLVVSAVAVGGGTVTASHGVLPVPAPATARLLLGIPVVPGPHDSELTTPTGAALVAVCASEFGSCPPMTPRLIGYGMGSRDIGTPNVCRVLLGDAAADPLATREEGVAILETNLDHLSPEAMAFVTEQLLAEGALDVWLSPIVMKKGRPASLLSVMTTPDTAEKTAERVIALTGTLGVRRSDYTRLVAEREVSEIPTEWGLVRIKHGAGRLRPEYDDVARVARLTGRPYEAVLRELEELAREFLQGN